MSSLTTTLTSNYEQLLERIHRASVRAGRDPAEITLVAVTKYAELEWVRELLSLGVRELGESRPQQLDQRARQIDGGVHWHLVGHLQRNKVRRTLPVVTMIHSVDSLRLLERIDSVAQELDLKPRMLLEVNISGEEAKDGFDTDALRREWDSILGVQSVEIEGLMTMAPYADDPQQSRPVFRGLRRLRDELAGRSPARSLEHLSMGMSGDFEVAIEEGATIIRIGSSLFSGLGPAPRQ